MAPFCVCASANKHQARRAVRNGDGAQLLARSFFFTKVATQRKVVSDRNFMKVTNSRIFFLNFFLLPLPSNVSLFSFLFPLISLFSSLPFFYSLSLSPDFFIFSFLFFSFLFSFVSYFSRFSLFSVLLSFLYIFFHFPFFSIFSFFLSFFSHLSPPNFTLLPSQSQLLSASS